MSPKQNRYDTAHQFIYSSMISSYLLTKEWIVIKKNIIFCCSKIVRRLSRPTLLQKRRSSGLWSELKFSSKAF
ncbi:hypothetical protein Hanom_Chr11g01014711 [Helianthus anomalus]